MGEDRVRQLLQGSPEEEEHFKYEVIRGLSESVRQLAAGMAEMQKTQVGMLERLAKLEANKFGEALVKAETKVDEMDKRIDALFRDKDRRDGALGAMGALRVWGPVIFSLFVAMYLVGRSLGVIPSPLTTVTKIETPLAVEPRRGAPAQPEATNGAAP